MGDAGRVAGGGLRNAPGFDSLDEGTSTVRETEKAQQDGSEVKPPATSEPPPTNPFQTKNPAIDGDTRKGEMFLRGQLMQAQLKAGPYSPPDPTPDSVIKDSTVGGKLDTDKLAKEMLKAAETSVSPKKFINETFDKLPKADRDKVARAIEKNIPDSQLKKLGSSFDGRDILDRIVNEYVFTGKAEHLKIARLHNAKLQGSLESYIPLQKSPTAKKAVLDELKKEPTNFPKNEALVELAKSHGFERMSDVTRKELFKYVEDNLGKPEFLKALNQIVSNPAFEKIGDTERSRVLKDLWNFTETPNYQRAMMPADRASSTTALAKNFPGLNDAQRKTVVADVNKFMGTKTFINLSPTDKDFALRIIGGLSAHSAKNPTFTTARNTLDKFLNDKISMKFVDFGRNSRVAAQADDGLMIFNVGASGRHLLDPKEVAEITAHEVNHILNGKTSPGTSERFLDEYRAYYMSRSAIGENPPKVDHMKRALKSLTTEGEPGDGYNHLRELYKKNPDYKKVVDKVIADLNKTPPKFTTPEDLRLSLRGLPGNDKSPYLNKPANMDNR